MSGMHTINTIIDKKIRNHLPVTNLAVSDNGDVIVAIPDEHQSRLYHIAHVTALGEWEKLSSFSVETLAEMDIARNGETFIGITDDDVYVFANGGKSRFFQDRRDNYIAVSVTANGQFFAVASADMLLSGYSITLARTSGGPIWTEDLPYSLTSIKISQDGSRIFAGSEDGASVMLDNSRKVLWEIDGDDPVVAVSGSSKFDTLAQGTKGGAIQAISSQGDKLWEVVGDGPVSACTISGDGKLIAVARTVSEGSSYIEFYDVNGTFLLQYDGLPKVNAVACSQDGHYIALSCSDGTFQVLELTLAPPGAFVDDHAQLLLEESDSDIKNNDIPEAIEKLTQVLLLVPSNIEACRKLIEVSDQFVNTSLQTADDFISSGSLESAVITLQDALKIDPYNQVLLEKMLVVREQAVSDAVSRADTAVEQHQSEEALEILKGILRLDFTNVEIREKIGKLDEDIVQKKILLADRAVSENRPEDAIGILEMAVELRPSSEIQEKLARARAEQAFQEGFALYEQKKYPQAAVYFRKAIGFDPNHSEAARYLEYSESFRQDDTLFDRFSRLE